MSSAQRHQPDDAETRQILEHLNQGSVAILKWSADSLWSILYATDNIYDITGYPASQFLEGMRFREIFHPEDIRRIQEETTFYTHIQNTDHYRLQPYRIIHRDGSIRWIRDQTHVQYDTTGKPVIFYAYLTDITAQKNNVDTLMVESVKYRSFFEKHSCVLLMIDPMNGQIVKANRSASAFYGYSIGELEQMSIMQINTLSRYEIKERMYETERYKRNYFIFNHRIASGEIRTVEVHSTAVQIYDRTFLFSIIHDISDRAQIESELRDLNQDLQRRVDTEIDRRTEIFHRYRLLFERMAGPVLIFDEKTCLDCNDAAMKLLGVDDRSAITGKELAEFAPSVQDDGRSSETIAEEAFTRVARTGHEQLRFLFRKPNGISIPVFLDLSLIHLDDRNVIYVICRDIAGDSEQKASILETERMLIQQTKLAAMGDMLSVIAHQWKQPLNAVSLMIQYLSELSINGEVSQEAIDRVTIDATTQLRYMSRTIDDFRDYFKPEAEERSFRIRSTILECVEILREQMAHHEIAIETSGGDFEITGFPNRFKQALINLLNNSRDAIDQRRIARPDIRGRIVIDVNDTLHKIDINDNGGGIPEEITDRIFQPYFTTRPVDRGTGLGLYIAKMIIESMNGAIRVQNLREGACFSIQF